MCHSNPSCFATVGACGSPTHLLHRLLCHAPRAACCAMLTCALCALPALRSTLTLKATYKQKGDAFVLDE